jgi:hypothetical protein
VVIMSLPRSSGQCVARLALGAITLSGAILFLVAAGHPLRAQTRPVPHPDSLLKSIDELRVEGSYASALARAEELERVLEARAEAGPEAHPWRLNDARRLVATLTRIAGLPPEAQAELAEADRADPVLEEMWARGEYAEGGLQAERQLSIRRRHLGETHPEVAASLNTLARFRYDQGDHPGAEAL